MKEPVGPGVRHDCGVYSGWEVPVHYDPILSKLITWGDDRESARKRMIKAMEDFAVLGVSTTIEFLAKVLDHQDFIDGETYTNFIDKNFPGGKIPDDEPEYLELAMMAAAIVDQRTGTAPVTAGTVGQSYDVWSSTGSWEIGK